MLPKYKFVLYSSTGYTGSTETHDNTTGTSAVCYLLTNRDTYQSVRVYYQANSFDIETEIVITNIS